MITRTALVFTLVFLTSCGSVGMIVSPTHNFTTSDTLALRRPVQNFVSVASEVGKSLGYDVSGVEANKVVLEDNTSLGMGVLVGKVGYKSVTLALQPGGRTIELNLTLAGNFNDATQEAATERLQKLKAALAARFH